MKKSLKRLTSAALAVMLVSGSVSVKGIENLLPSGGLGCVDVYAETITAKADGWKESAYVEWLPVSGAAKYEAYVKASGAAEYTKLDDELIRQYPTYCRADAVGLKAGSYTMKVTALDSSDKELASFESSTLTVKAHNRQGFAFSSGSFEKGAGLGGYKADGTPKDGAVILYITDANKNTITYDIVTNNKGGTTKGTGLGGIIKLFEKGYESRPFIFRFVGEVAPPYSEDKFKLDVTDEEFHNGNNNSYRILDVKDNMKNVSKGGITFEGIGADTVLHFNFNLTRAKDIEIRNFGFKDMTTKDEDGVTVTSGSTNFWVHNCDFFYGGQGSDKDQAKGDGTVDVKGTPDYGLVSENHFWDNGKALLCGLGESSDYHITYTANWFDHSDSRHPRTRNGSVHVYNNYYDGVAKYGVGVTSGGSAFVEGNYFRNVNDPMLISQQGTDGNGSGTFSGDDGGIIKAYDNIMVGSYQYIEGITKKEDGTKSYNKWADAYTVDTRDEQLPATLTATAGGTAYNNFDTKLDLGVSAANVLAAKDVPAFVIANAGRCNGGNFVFKFNNAFDDTDYEVNSDLTAALAAYRNNIVTIGGTVTTQPDTTAAASSMTGVDGNSTYAERDHANYGFVSTLPAETDPAGNRATGGGAVPDEVTIPENAVIIPTSEPTVSCDPSSTAVSDENCVIYQQDSDDYLLKDTSTSASTVWTVPFTAQSSGVVYVTGRVSGSDSSGKWNLLRINGKYSDSKSGQIISLASDADKKLSLWIKGADAGKAIASMGKNANYFYTFKLDLDNKTAELDVNGKVVSAESLDVSEISSIVMMTPKSKAINLTASLPIVYTLGDTPVADVVWGDWDGDKAVTASDATFILQYVLTPDKMDHTEEQVNRCKVLGDESITASDAAAVLQKTLDGKMKFPVEK
ncbi:MAG: hypothetical protein IJ062_09310 [Firmicutes bacterium]|nr:hypothetical protein [Bacillota bacterium]